MGWKWPVIFVSVLGSLGLAGWGVSLRLDAALETHLQESLAIQASFPVDPTPRPAILGPEEGGRIWELLIPAFAGLEALDPTPDSDLRDSMAQSFDARGPGAPLIEEARPYLELCRRAACRNDATWTGPPVLEPLDKVLRWASRRDATWTKEPESELPARAGRAVRVCCARAFLLWRERRDAEAVEWLIAALTVAYDSVKLSGSWRLLEITEHWVIEDFRSLLEEQDLTAPQLEELGRRLQLLRSARPSFLPRLRIAGSIQRLEILEEDVPVTEEAATSDHDGNLSEMVGWRDFWSIRFARARILNDIRRCGSELEGLSWQNPRATVTEADRILNTYRGRYVNSLLPYGSPFSRQEAELEALDVLSVAVGCARFQAAQGRLPRTWAESGIALPVTGRIDLGEDRLSTQPTGDWVIGRRSRPK